jgi:hypothetical protein
MTDAVQIEERQTEFAVATIPGEFTIIDLRAADRISEWPVLGPDGVDFLTLADILLLIR